MNNIYTQLDKATKMPRPNLRKPLLNKLNEIYNNQNRSSIQLTNKLTIAKLTALIKEAETEQSEYEEAEAEQSEYDAQDEYEYTSKFCNVDTSILLDNEIELTEKELHIKNNTSHIYYQRRIEHVQFMDRKVTNTDNINRISYYAKHEVLSKYAIKPYFDFDDFPKLSDRSKVRYRIKFYK